MVYFCLTGQNAPPLSLPFSSPLPKPQGTGRFNATKANFPAQMSKSEVDAHHRVQLVLGYWLKEIISALNDHYDFQPQIRWLCARVLSPGRAYPCSRLISLCICTQPSHSTWGEGSSTSYSKVLSLALPGPHGRSIPWALELNDKLPRSEKKNYLKMVIKTIPVTISKSRCLICWKTQSLLQLHRPISQGELAFSNTQCLQQEARAPVSPAGLSRSHPLLSLGFPQNLSPVQNFPWQKWPGRKREHFGWRVCLSCEVFVCHAPGTWI